MWRAMAANSASGGDFSYSLAHLKNSLPQQTISVRRSLRRIGAEAGVSRQEPLRQLMNTHQPRPTASRSLQENPANVPCGQGIDIGNRLTACSYGAILPCATSMIIRVSR
jgi:hypothetical protein